jgi:hypothetical protein
LPGGRRNEKPSATSGYRLATLRFDPALEALDLYPNPKQRILESNPQYGGKMITDLL